MLRGIARDPSRPPLSCRTSPPRGEIGCQSAFANLQRVGESQAAHLPPVGRCPAGQRGATSSSDLPAIAAPRPPRARRRPARRTSFALPTSIRPSARTCATPARRISSAGPPEATRRRPASSPNAAAKALSEVQQRVAGEGLTLVVFDCYRPVRAVDDFVAWTRAGRTARPALVSEGQARRPDRRRLYRRALQPLARIDGRPGARPYRRRRRHQPARSRLRG